jgi:preprotein translocase subunit SecD
MLVFLGYTVDYSLDLAGIAGLVIGIGMTADSYVVFFERIKDELRDGHRFRSAVPRAWKSASRTIVTGNMVSLIGAVVLYMLASGEVRGFAFTLGLTTLTDVFVAFTVTWPLVFLASTKDLFSKPSANGMGRMANLQAAAAERRRTERSEEQASAQSRARGVTATIQGPEATPTAGPSIRPATDEEEGR